MKYEPKLCENKKPDPNGTQLSGRPVEYSGCAAFEAFVNRAGLLDLKRTELSTRINTAFCVSDCDLSETHNSLFSFVLRTN